MNFKTIQKKHYPNAISLDEYFEKTTKFFNSLGFTKENTIACTCTCRDENTKPLVHKVDKTWGDSFTISGLAGLLVCGKSSFNAYIHHAPDPTTAKDKKANLLFFGMAHIGISEKGEIGVVYRPGLKAKSNSCGALCGFLKEMENKNGCIDLTDKNDDVEFQWMKRRIIKEYPLFGSKKIEKPDLVSLTKICEKIIVDDFNKIIKDMVDFDKFEVGMCVGTQIHGEKEMFINPLKVQYWKDEKTIIQM